MALTVCHLQLLLCSSRSLP